MTSAVVKMPRQCKLRPVHDEHQFTTLRGRDRDYYSSTQGQHAAIRAGFFNPHCDRKTQQASRRSSLQATYCKISADSQGDKNPSETQKPKATGPTSADRPASRADAARRSGRRPHPRRYLTIQNADLVCTDGLQGNHISQPQPGEDFTPPSRGRAPQRPTGRPTAQAARF